eukprot:jgi/Chlat1/3634/Chrsp237S03616
MPPRPQSARRGGGPLVQTARTSGSAGSSGVVGGDREEAREPGIPVVRARIAGSPVVCPVSTGSNISTIASNIVRDLGLEVRPPPRPIILVRGPNREEVNRVVTATLNLPLGDDSGNINRAVTFTFAVVNTQIFSIVLGNDFLADCDMSISGRGLIFLNGETVPFGHAPGNYALSQFAEQGGHNDSSSLSQFNRAGYLSFGTVVQRVVHA